MENHTSQNRRRDTSLLGRFILYALVFSLVPFLLLGYFYTLANTDQGYIAISRLQLMVFVGLAAVAAILALIRVGSKLWQLYRFNRTVKKQMPDGVDKESLRDYSEMDGEVGSLARYMRRMLTQLEERDEELSRARTALNNPLSSLSTAIEFTTNFETQVALILELTLKYMGAKRGAVFSKDSKRFRLISYVADGRACGSEIGQSLENTLRLLSPEERLVLRPVTGDEGEVRRFGPPLACVAMVQGDRVVGAICLSGHTRRRNWSEEETGVLTEIADNLASAFDLFLSGSNRDQTFFATLCVLAGVVELRDPHLMGHANRVAYYGTVIGEAMSLDDEEIIVIRDAAKVHDIGNLGIHASILTKPDHLNRTEREMIVQHPAIGERIIASLPSYRRLLDPIRHHHEFLDGSGYPDQLRSDAISMATRVLTVANVFDALTSGRAYREAYGVPEALEMLAQMAADSKVDSSIVEALTKLVQKGEVVVLGAGGKPAWEGAPRAVSF